MNELKPCKLCGEETPNVFNIAFEAIPICEDCAMCITLQQINWIQKTRAVDKSRKKLNKT